MQKLNNLSLSLALLLFNSVALVVSKSDGDYEARHLRLKATGTRNEGSGTQMRIRWLREVKGLYGRQSLRKKQALFDHTALLRPCTDVLGERYSSSKRNSHR